MKAALLRGHVGTRERVYWVFVALLVMCTSVLNLVRAERLRDSLREERQLTIEKALDSHVEAWSAVGEQVSWSRLEQLGGSPIVKPAGPLLILSVSQSACFGFREAAAQIANRIASQVGADAVIGVIHSATKQFTASYARVNGLGFPVFHDPEDSFIQRNPNLDRPRLMLVDENWRVVAVLNETTSRQLADGFVALSIRRLSARANKELQE